jgi:putative transposase
MKYRPDYPARFGSLQDARTWAQAFFDWYNHAHHHLSLRLLTPAIVHFGQAPAVLAQRQDALAAAYRLHPERFVNGPPRPEPVPEAGWINPPPRLHANRTDPA